MKPNGQALLKYLNDHHRRLLPIVAIHRLNQFTVSSNFAEDLKKIYFHDRDIELETVDSLVEVSMQESTIMVEIMGSYKITAAI